MRHYFLLRAKLAFRAIRDFGISPWLGLGLVFVFFVLGSMYLFYRLSYASWLYVFFAWMALAAVENKAKNEFLASLYGRRQLWNIRAIESGIVLLPFVPMLLLQGAWLALALLLGLGMFHWLFPFQWASQGKSYSPFSRQPFEFSIGFRKSFFVVLLLLSICSLALYKENYGFAFACFGLSFLLQMGYYMANDPPLYVWVHGMSPKRFLFHKLSLALGQSMLISAPFVLLISFSVPSFMLWYPLVIQLLGFCVLAFGLFAKYSAFPHKQALPELILLALCLGALPLFLLALPYLYRKAIRKLKPLLNDRSAQARQTVWQ